MAGPTVVLPAARNVTIGPLAKWFSGDDIVFQFTIVDSAGAVRNITGWNLAWYLRERASDPDITLQKVAALTSPTTGLCTVTIAAADTVNLPAGWYDHALRRTDSGAGETAAWGRAILHKGAAA